MKQEINSVVYGAFLNVDYLPEADKYVYQKEAPRYKFAVIGAGMIAQEHIRVTKLEGRGEIHGIF